MTATLRLIADKLAGHAVREAIPSGITLHELMCEQVPDYTPGPVQPLTLQVDGVYVAPKRWHQVTIQPGVVVTATAEPKDPVTTIYAIIAVASAVMAYTAYRAAKESYNDTSPSGSSVYSANVQVNRARLLGVCPEGFGTHRYVPDIITPPHRFFKDNEEWLRLGFGLGVGEYDIQSLIIANSTLAQLGADVSYNIFPPGADVSAEPAFNVMYEVPEVGEGLQLKGGLESLTFGAALNRRLVYPSYPANSNKTLWGLEHILRDGKWIVQGRQMVGGVGDRIQVTTDAESVVLFEGVVNVVDNDPDPDTIEAPFGLGDLIGGEKVQIIGLGANDGTYKIGTVTSTSITLLDPANNDAPLLGLAPVTGAFIRIIKDSDNNGLFEITAVDTVEYIWGTYMPASTVDKVTVIKVGDPAWPGFSSATPYHVTIAGARELVGWDMGDAHIELVTGSLPQNVLGPYAACPDEQATSSIELDFTWQGLGKYSSSGGINNLTLQYEIHWREAGTSNAWNVIPKSKTAATADQLAETVTINIPNIRPEVKVVMISPQHEDSAYLEDMRWNGCKALLGSSSSFEHMTTISLEIKGTNTLSSQAENQFRVKAQRKLPVPDGQGGWTQTLQPTNAVIPALRYVLHDVGYSDAGLNLLDLLPLHDLFEAKGIEFNGIFDNATTVFETLKKLLYVGMAKPVLDLGQWSAVRDDVRTLPKQIFTTDNTLSIKQDVRLLDTDARDGVEVEYMDPVSWKPEVVDCLLPGDLGKDKEKIRVFGCTDKTQAWRIGMRERRAEKYRRISWTIETEMDGLNVLDGDLIGIGDGLPSSPDSSTVYAINGNVIELEQPVRIADGVVHKVGLRKPDGSLDGPHQVVSADVEQWRDGEPAYRRLTLATAPAIGVRRDIDPPLLLCGPADAWCALAIVEKVRPQGSEKVSITASQYAADVYADDENSPP